MFNPYTNYDHIPDFSNYRILTQSYYLTVRMPVQDSKLVAQSRLAQHGIHVSWKPQVSMLT